MPDPVTTSKQQERCETMDCSRPSVATARWVDDKPYEARYCASCADVMTTHMDADVEWDEPAQPVEQATFDPRHPHEPEQQPLLLNDGACAVCRIAVRDDALTAANQQIEEGQEAYRLASQYGNEEYLRAETAEAKIEELTRELDGLAFAVRECDTNAEQVGDPVESYRIAKAPWHRLLALTGPGPHPQSEGELWQARAEAAEAQRDTLREGIESLSVECRQEAMTQRDDYALTDNARSDAYARIGGRLRSLLTTPPAKPSE